MIWASGDIRNNWFNEHCVAIDMIQGTHKHNTIPGDNEHITENQELSWCPAFVATCGSKGWRHDDQRCRWVYIPNSRGTWDWLTTKNGQTRGYSGVGWQGRMFLLSYSPEGHKLLLDTRKKWTRAYTPLKSTSSTIAFNRQKRSWNLSISLASGPTRSWILLWSQVFTDWS